MFIDKDMRPPQRFLQQNNLFDMFDSDKMGGVSNLLKILLKVNRNILDLSIYAKSKSDVVFFILL